MHGAIAGDFIGSRYEHNNVKRKGFPLFGDACHYTDDTVMTVAIADALIKACESGAIADERRTKRMLISSMHRWGNKYPYAGYGKTFFSWLKSWSSKPYNSWGNGSAMRVSAAGWLFEDIVTTRKVARWTAEITHNHPEGIKGAEAVASAVYLARTGYSKAEIQSYITKAFGYDLERSCDDIRPDYTFDVSCQGSVPEAIIAFLEGCNCEDTIRNAVSLGGDSDTIAAMAGSIAEAYYGTGPEWRFFKEAERKLPDDIREVLERFDQFRLETVGEMDTIGRNNISESRVRLMPQGDRLIVKAYMDGSSVRQIAEELDRTDQDILRVLHKAMYYGAIERKTGRNMNPGFIWYLNSIITKSNDKTLWLRQLEEPRRFLIPCAFKFEEPEFMIIGILRNADKLPADTGEYIKLTGHNVRRMRMAVNRVNIQIRLGRGRREILDSMEGEGDEND